MVKLNADFEQSLISLKDREVMSQISCVPGEATKRETLVSRLCHSTLSRLGKDKTRSCWCDTRGLMSPLSKHICLRGKDLFINLWIDGTKRIWKKERTVSITKVVCRTKHAFASRQRVLMLIRYFIAYARMFPKYSDNNLPAPTPIPHPFPRHCAVLFSLSGWSAVTFTK